MTAAPQRTRRHDASPDPPSINNRLCDSLVAQLIATALLAAFFALLPVRHDSDSYLAVPVSYALLTSGSPEVTRYVETYEVHHAIQWQGARALPYYPLGTSILALPIVAALAPFDPLLGEPSYMARDDWAAVGKLAASIIGALAACLLFRLLRRLSGRVAPAAALTLVFAVATPLVSSATRGLWQHGPVMLCYCAALLLLLAGRTRPSALLWAALPVAFAVICRPWAGAFAILVAVHLLLRHRRQLPGFLAIGGAIALVWLACNWAIYGVPLPDYYRPQSFQWRSYVTTGEAIWGPLLSPSRGLLVWCPFLLFCAASLFDRAARRDPLVQLSAVMLLAQWILTACSPNWFGGHSIGPRLMSDALPFCFVLLLPAAARLVAAPSLAWRLARPLALLALLFAAWVHLRAASEYDQVAWNYTPTNVGRPWGYDRLWDWRDPQFLRGTAFSGLDWARDAYGAPPPPPPMLGRLPVNSRHGEAAALLRDGWSHLEDWGVWSSGARASLAIPWSAIPPSARILSLAVRPFLATGLGQQRVSLRLPTGEALTWSLDRDEPTELSLPLPPRPTGQADLMLVLDLPDARSPASVGLNADRRLLAIGLLGLRFDPL